MALKYTEGGTGILDMENPKETNIRKRLTDVQTGSNPYLAELVGDDYEQDDTDEDHIPQLNLRAV